MTVTVAAFADVTFCDRPALAVRATASRLARHLLLATTACITIGVAAVGLTLTAGWLVAGIMSHRHGDWVQTNRGLRDIALAPPSYQPVTTALGPADIVVFPPSMADAARPAHLADAVPLPRKRAPMTEPTNDTPLPPAMPEALAGLRSAEKVASLPPEPPPAPAPAPQRPVALRHADKPATPKLADNHTAVYDISARVVYLPSGKTLEAHSGLGDMRDDPHYIGTRMRGPTPPNTYDLSLREALFHGVRAIRLTPADEDKMFGRAGMLAHTYMLGPEGDSNGCVSFRNYDAFLQAYMRGEIDRLVVVARNGATLAHTARGNSQRDVRYASSESGPGSSRFSAAQQ